jgi:hypothetical protein
MEGYDDGNEVGDREGKGEAGFVFVGCREGEEDGGAVGDLSDWLQQSSVSYFFSPKIM